MRKAKLDETKEGIRKKRKRPSAGEEKDDTRSEADAGTRPLKLKKKKSVSFA
jgi:60S ribosomal subunit assembly/export protein LOC1